MFVFVFTFLSVHTTFPRGTFLPCSGARAFVKHCSRIGCASTMLATPRGPDGRCQICPLGDVQGVDCNFSTGAWLKIGHWVVSQCHLTNLPALHCGWDLHPESHLLPLPRAWPGASRLRQVTRLARRPWSPPPPSRCQPQGSGILAQAPVASSRPQGGMGSSRDPLTVP